MSDPAAFTVANNWAGGFYELHMQLGPSDRPDAEAGMLRALAAVWADPQVVGCYLTQDAEPEDQDAVEPVPLDPAHPGHFYGRATLPFGPTVVCGTVASRDLEDDWLAFYLPMGTLATADLRIGAHPFGSDATSRSWRAPIDSWLIAMAHRVHTTVPIQRAAIGFEAWDCCEGPVPISRYVTYIIRSGDTLIVHTPTRWD